MPTFDQTKIATLAANFPKTYMRSLFGTKQNKTELESYIRGFNSSKIKDLEELKTKITTILEKIPELSVANQSQYKAFQQAAQTVIREIEAYKKARRETIRSRINPVVSSATTPYLTAQQNADLIQPLHEMIKLCNRGIDSIESLSTAEDIFKQKKIEKQLDELQKNIIALEKKLKTTLTESQISPNDALMMVVQQLQGIQERFDEKISVCNQDKTNKKAKVIVLSFLKSTRALLGTIIGSILSVLTAFQVKQINLLTRSQARDVVSFSKNMVEAAKPIKIKPFGKSKH
jgi:hypothetical protein